MKLALMALGIEICLARIFVNSWGWAAVLVTLYCTLVFAYMARKGLLSKKSDQYKNNIKSANAGIKGYINVNRQSEQKIYNMYKRIDVLHNN